LGNNNIGNGAAAPVTVNSNLLLKGNVTFIGMNGGATNATGNNPLTLLGSISDDSATSGIARSITKAGTHTLTLSGNNTYTGNTTITGGSLVLGAANRISDVSNLVLSGGTFNTGGFNETLNSLRVTSNSIIDLGTGASVLRFAPSSIGWTGTLTINNWDGNPTDPTLGAGVDQVFFGNNGFSGLSRTQLNSVQFANQPLGAMLLSNGELVPNTSGIPLPTMVQGDYNQNGVFDPGDISAMLKALTDLKAYAISKQISDGDVVAIGDFDSSGTVTNADIQPLLDLAINSGFGSVATVPEPASITLLLAGGVAICTCRGKRRRLAR
jgi:autotransporter-associated beta strand protein